MRNYIWMSAIALVLLSGCGNISQNSSQKSSANSSDKKATITTGRVNNNVYQALMEEGQYKTATGKEISAGGLNNNNYNQNNYENGLIRLSKELFSTNDYYFMEGKEIPPKELKSWVGRKSVDNTEGLNAEGDENPLLLQKIVEYDFVSTSDQTLGGMSIGLILNKIDYNEDTPKEISQEDLEDGGKTIGEELLKRIRKIKGLEQIPITIALFQQATKDDIAGGNYILQGTSDKGSTGLKWTELKEEHILLPNVSENSNTATEDGLSTKFNEFKNSVQTAFPSLSGITGIAYYKDKQLQDLSITIETKYSTKTEITSLTQYAGKTAETQFNFNAPLEIEINTINKPQAFLYREIDDQTIHSHVFE